jgi:hypothetical protein
MTTIDYKTLDELINKYGVIMVLHCLAEIIADHTSKSMKEPQESEDK